jgi:spermidine synthase
MLIKEIDKYQMTAEILNERGISPFSARSWNWENVRSIAYFNRKNAKAGFIKRPDVMAVIREVTIKLLDNAREKETIN